MNEAEVLVALEEHGAVRRGHFTLSSGLHSDLYVQCALALQWPGLAERLGHELGERFAHLAPTVVLGPAMGGLVIAHETARYLCVRMIFSERAEGTMTLRRGFTLAGADRVLVAEDVVTTGRSQAEAMDVVHAAGATMIGIAAIVDRSGGTSFGVPYEALARIEPRQWGADACPLCTDGTPAEQPGSRHLTARRAT